MDLVIMVFGE